MAEAIARGLLSAGVFTAERLLASDPNPARRELFESKLGITAVDENARLASQCQTILLAVKPQDMAEALGQLRAGLSPETLIISIAAGVSTQYIARMLRPEPWRLIRVMPNTAMLVGEGTSAIARGQHASDDDLALARRLFEAAGRTIVVQEGLMDAVTAVSGSGPAYLFYLAEAMVAGGTQAGLSPEQALTLTRLTLAGAGRLLAESGQGPEQLRRMVTSPGGTTEAAVAVLDEAGVAEQLRRAVMAAAERSRQLGR